VLAEEAMSHQQVPRERDPRDADVRACFLEMYQEMSNSKIDDLNVLMSNSEIADELYDVGWNQYHVSRYIDELYEDI
jgi:hypothetical protein